MDGFGDRSSSEPGGGGPQTHRASAELRESRAPEVSRLGGGAPEGGGPPWAAAQGVQRLGWDLGRLEAMAIGLEAIASRLMGLMD